MSTHANLIVNVSFEDGGFSGVLSIIPGKRNPMVIIAYMGGKLENMESIGIIFLNDVSC